MKLKLMLLSLMLGFFCQMSIAQFVQIDSLKGTKGLFEDGGFFGSKDSTLFYIVKKEEGTLALKAVTNGKNPQIIVDSIKISSYIRDFTIVDDDVFFTISSSSIGKLYKTKGTKSTTNVIRQAEYFGSLRAFKNNLIFHERVDFTRSLSMYNISNKQIELLSEFNFWGALDIVVKDTMIYIIGDKDKNDIALLSSKGKKNDLQVIKVLNNTSRNSHTFMSVSGNYIFFFFESKALSGSRYLWASDGTASGTKELLYAEEQSFFDTPVNITYNGKYYTRARKKNGDDVIYISNGTPGGTAELAYKSNDGKYDIPLSFRIYQNKLYFTATDVSWNRRLWVINGSNPAEIAVGVSNDYIYGSNIDTYKDSLLVIGEKNKVGTDFLLFGGSGNYNNLTNENKNKPLSFNFTNFRKVGTRLYVIADKEKTGYELWEYNAKVVTPLTISIILSIPIKCSGDKTASLKANPLGATAPYQYLWNTGATTDNINQLAAGVYSVTVTSSDSKKITSSITITEPSKITLTTTTKAANPQFKNGNATVEATGGIAPYTYAWSTNPIQTTKTATGLIPAAYSVTVSDTNQCKVETKVTISLSTSSNELWDKYSFKAFPNPTSEQLSIDFEGVTLHNGTITLSDLQGRIIAEQAISDNHVQLNVAELPEGVYLVKCTLNEKEIATSTIVIKR
jgi:hypothetical protein